MKLHILCVKNWRLSPDYLKKEFHSDINKTFNTNIINALSPRTFVQGRVYTLLSTDKAYGYRTLKSPNVAPFIEKQV